MQMKLFGAMLVIVGCGAVGFFLASAYRKEIKQLRQLVGAIEKVEWELQYRMSPLPELCEVAASACTDALHKLFKDFRSELDAQISPDAERCMSAALARSSDVQKLTRQKLNLLGSLLGRYDLEGQINGLASVCQACKNSIDKLETGKEQRLRGYQTISVCVGALIVILLV